MKRICLIALLLVLTLLTACDKNDNLVQSENNSQTDIITNKNEKLQEIACFEEVHIPKPDSFGATYYVDKELDVDDSMVLYSYAFDSENELGEYLDVLELYLIEGDITVDEQPDTVKYLYKDEKILGVYWCCTLPDISSTACAIQITFLKNT